MDQTITGVDFVALHTKDLMAAQRFYGETLGLPRTAHKDGYFAEFDAGPLTLCLMDAEAFGFPFQVSATGIALHVADVAAARATFAGRGVAFAADTIDTGVCHMAMFQDPDGNALLLHSRYAPRVPENA